LRLPTRVSAVCVAGPLELAALDGLTRDSTPEEVQDSLRKARLLDVTAPFGIETVNDLFELTQEEVERVYQGPTLLAERAAGLMAVKHLASSCSSPFPSL